MRDAVLIEVPGQAPGSGSSHALMQRYLYRELGSARQTELHRQIALAMERRAERGVIPVAELASALV